MINSALPAQCMRITFDKILNPPAYSIFIVSLPNKKKISPVGCFSMACLCSNSVLVFGEHTFRCSPSGTAADDNPCTFLA
jgi:hypothetical protein